MRIEANGQMNVLSLPEQFANSYSGLDFLWLLLLNLTDGSYDNQGDFAVETGLSLRRQSADFDKELKMLADELKTHPSYAEPFLARVYEFIYLLHQFLEAQSLRDSTSLASGLSGIIRQEEAKALKDVNQPSDKGLLSTKAQLEDQSLFLSKAWGNYKALSQEGEKGVSRDNSAVALEQPEFNGQGRFFDKAIETKLNQAEIRERFFNKLQMLWETLSGEVKTYLARALGNTFTAEAKVEQGKVSLIRGGEVKAASAGEAQTGGALRVENSLENFLGSKEVLEAERPFPVSQFVDFLGQKEPQLVAKFNPWKLSKASYDQVRVWVGQNQPVVEALRQVLESQSSERLSQGLRLPPSELPDFVRSLLLEMGDQGEYRARLDLHPPELGSIDIEIKVKDGEVAVVGKIEKMEAYQEVLRDVAVIRAQLEEAGFRVRELNFTLGGNEQWATFGEDRSNRQRGDAQRFSERRKAEMSKFKVETLSLVNTRGRYYYVV